MGKSLFISEKPSVAQDFAKALKINGKKQDGYIESEDAVVTWCVGHLVTMSYPEIYDPALKKWNFQTLPFLPERFLYEVIPTVKKQYEVVSKLLNRKDIDKIYVCTDSGREGEYIYRLVDEMAQVGESKEKLRVWIDSQTEEEILRGIQDAKPLSEYDNLASAAYLRAKEDYLMGINFSRALTLKYGNAIMDFLNNGKWSAVSVGRVMTCVLGMVVRREREIRDFVETPFYRVIATFGKEEETAAQAPKQATGQTTGSHTIEGEWRAVEGSEYAQSPLLYKENGFRKEEDAKKLIEKLLASGKQPVVEKVEKKTEKKNPPLLYNLAELQNDCSRMFKISPDETLKIAQELYEKKLVTYPRTDARVLSSAVAKEIHKNLQGLTGYSVASLGTTAAEILKKGSHKKIGNTRYTNDKQITDHYAIIPTGQGLGQLGGLTPLSAKVYQAIVRRFLCIFLPPAVYQKLNLIVKIGIEHFFTSFRLLIDPGYLKIANPSATPAGQPPASQGTAGNSGNTGAGAGNLVPGNQEGDTLDAELVAFAGSLKKGMILILKGMNIKEGKTSPPKRYNSGSMILAMENAGQLIEDEELRAQIKGSGIGTSATRAEILNKLVKINYLKLNKKTQIITPAQQGELVYEVVYSSIRSLLNPELTASWEKGLTYVSEGSISEEEYMQKLTGFVSRMTEGVKKLGNQSALRGAFDRVAAYYK
ncbi:MAG: type IA DNA topoisomerase [Lachnospiraceae bacterium]|nr:type IA DNA topoisomerase [Lachnospiraceae bacterium]